MEWTLIGAKTRPYSLPLIHSIIIIEYLCLGVTYLAFNYSILALVIIITVVDHNFIIKLFLDDLF